MPVRFVVTVAFTWATLATLHLSDAADAVPVPIQSGAATLTPQNTKIQFVCAHVGARPDPRKGGFAKFKGTAEIDATTRSLKSLDVDIDTTSLFTEFDMLTNHLKSQDFFDVRRFPTAHYEATRIESGDSGTAQITGKLTLHGVTRQISFPATMELSNAGLKLRAEFTLDRSEFGMNYDPKKVENKVSLTIIVGEKS